MTSYRRAVEPYQHEEHQLQLQQERDFSEAEGAIAGFNLEQPTLPTPLSTGSNTIHGSSYLSLSYLPGSDRPPSMDSQLLRNGLGHITPGAGSQRYTPGGGNQIHSQQHMTGQSMQQLENHIHSRPFQFSSLPGRRNGSIANNATEGAPQQSSLRQSNQLAPLLNTPSEAGPSTNTPSGTNGVNGVMNGNPKGRQPGGASDFVKKLYKMLEEDRYKNTVIWGAKGDSFIVKDMADFTKTILPQHFKHSNFASFVRQLNKYDFHKVKNPESQGDTPGESSWEFKHPNFSTDMQHSLENIKRKITTAKKPDTPAAISASAPPQLPPSHSLQQGHPGSEVELLGRQISVLTHNQKQIEAHMDRFTAQYQALMADLLGQHRAIAAQDAFTASFLQYMINLEYRLNSITNPSEPPSFPPSNEAQHLMATYSELSRARYDKMTESTRRAEALGFFVNGMRRRDSPLQDGTDSSPEFSRSSLPFGNGMPRLPQPPPSTFPHQSQPSLHQPQFGHQQQQQQAFAPQHPSYFSHQMQLPQHSDSPTASSEATHDSGPTRSFASLGDIRLGSEAGTSQSLQQQVQQHQHQQQNRQYEEEMSYFPAPGSMPIRPSTAITPGAVMITTLNHHNNTMVDSQIGQGGLDGEDQLTPGTAGLTAANTKRNMDLAVVAEGEDIAAFAAALKGGQSSAAVRSALTAQPLLVRRATYIPGWSVAPRVLLVEDDAVCRNLTTKFLQIFGCQIEVASDGVEAVNRMQTGVYDVCLMDISMPNLDGVSATSLIRQFDAMTPIISMTGNSRPDEIHTYFSHGMNDVLPKPFTKEGMLSMLEKHLIHLKNIHQNPDIVPDPAQLDDFDFENFDPSSTSENPFFGLGISNEDYLSILNGNAGNTRWSATPSPSPGLLLGGSPTKANTGGGGNLGKRGQEDDGTQEGLKRTRFEEI